MASKVYGATKGSSKSSNISSKGGSSPQKKYPVQKSAKVPGISPASSAIRKMSANRSKTVSGASKLVTGGVKKWSGAAGAAGGKSGKTYGGVKGVTSQKTTGKIPAQVPNALKPPKMTGHTAGKMPGNMMAHSSKTMPFQNTGMHPQGGKVGEVSLAALTSSQAKAPGAAKTDKGQLNKLASGNPYGMPSGWSGGSGAVGGTTAKTYGKKSKKG